MRRRRTELGLVVMAAAITVGAYVLAALGREATMPADIGPFLGMVVALLLVAHVATRRLAPEADPLLLPIAVLLNGIGYVFIARLAHDVRNAKALPGLQATWVLIGVAAYVATLVFVRRVRVLERYRYTFMAAGVLLLLLPSVPGIGRTVNGARIWIRVGGVSFQPGEVAKLALAVFFAAYLVERRELLRIGTFKVGRVHLPEPKHLAPVLLAWGASLLVLVRQNDFGTSLLFFALFVVMLWVGTERAGYLVVGGSLFAIGSFTAYQLFDRLQSRVDMWLDPWQDPQGSGYQVLQAAFAMADGGITGTGLGLGRPTIVPEVATDFIFAAIAEELGLFGSTAVLVCYLLLVGSGLRVALSQRRPFEKLLATGLTTLIGIQAFIIIGGVTRVVPLTGITLPFVSYGGSSLVANYVLLALLVRLSDEANREDDERRRRWRDRPARASARQASGAAATTVREVQT
jgi:cell division protein FtsW (lipid II flippase)